MSDYRDALKMIGKKKSKIARFEKHNVPKKKKFGLGTSKCQRCGKVGVGVIRKYNLNYCRRCFREIAKDLGFKKYG